MKNVIEILEKQYQSFINQERDWNFFLGLADYVDFVNRSPEFNQPLDRIKERKSKAIEVIDRLEKEAIAELLKIKKELLKIIKNEKITKQDLPEALSKLKDYEKGSRFSGKALRLQEKYLKKGLSKLALDITTRTL